MSQELREEAQRREQERRRRVHREREFAGDVLLIASRPEGKRLFRRLLEEGDIFSTAWIPGAAGAYHAGRKAQALALWKILREHLSGSDCLELILPDPGETGPTPDEDGEWSGEERTPDEF